jgi:hypothetical protein
MVSPTNRPVSPPIGLVSLPIGLDQSIRLKRSSLTNGLAVLYFLAFRGVFRCPLLVIQSHDFTGLPSAICFAVWSVLNLEPSSLNKCPAIGKEGASGSFLESFGEVVAVEPDESKLALEFADTGVQAVFPACHVIVSEAMPRRCGLFCLYLCHESFSKLPSVLLLVIC